MKLFLKFLLYSSILSFTYYISESIFGNWPADEQTGSMLWQVINQPNMVIEELTHQFIEIQHLNFSLKA